MLWFLRSVNQAQAPDRLTRFCWVLITLTPFHSKLSNLHNVALLGQMHFCLCDALIYTYENQHYASFACIDFPGCLNQRGLSIYLSIHPFIIWHTHTHTHTHTLSHTGSSRTRILWFQSTGAFSPWCADTCEAKPFHAAWPPITLHLNLPLTRNFVHFYFLKKTNSVWFISLFNYGDTENVPINHLLLVIPVIPCIIPLYKFVSS